MAGNRANVETVPIWKSARDMGRYTTSAGSMEIPTQEPQTGSRDGRHVA